MSQELGARHMVSAILMILVVITIILVLIFIVPIAKDFLSKDELSREKIDKLLEDFDIYTSRLNKCYISTQECRCPPKNIEMPSSYKLIIDKGGSTINLLNNNEVKIAEKELSTNKNCIVKILNMNMQPEFLDSEFIITRDDNQDFLSWKIPNENKFVKEEIIFIYKFSAGQLCYVTESIYGKQSWFNQLSDPNKKQKINNLFSKSLCKVE